MKVYTSWFALSSFIIPLLAMAHWHVRICWALRQNLAAKRRCSAEEWGAMARTAVIATTVGGGLRARVGSLAVSAVPVQEVAEQRRQRNSATKTMATTVVRKGNNR